MVFFKLKQASDQDADKLVAACHKHLSGHEGTVYFSVGKLAADMQREVNDRDFDVALHVVFDSRESHDAYQESPRHASFLKEAMPLWSGVRVFDSNLAEPPSSPDEAPSAVPE